MTDASTYDPTAAPTMPPPSNSLPSLTLILAATPSLGIGKNGTLPWPQLRKEMGYFARVTKRVSEGQRRVNAVVMGRKTWDSIPEKFRPLKGRVNVVVTRKPEQFSAAKEVDGDNVEGPIVAGSMSAALDKLHSFSSSQGPPPVHRIFVIGGSSIYNAALQLPQTDRVLLTKIRKEYECDTLFSVDLDAEGSGWVKRGRKELEEWTGESITEGGVEEAGVEFEFGMYERVV
jgi:dihydrofolate reductase